MNKLAKIHAASGTLALVVITLFWCSTLYSEITGNLTIIYQVKKAILYGFGLLFPLMMMTGISGNMLAKKKIKGLVKKKLTRMKIIMFNGIVILIPSAVYLFHSVSLGDLGTLFYTVQALELTAGLINLILLSMNIRDGLRLSQFSLAGLS